MDHLGLVNVGSTSQPPPCTYLPDGISIGHAHWRDREARRNGMTLINHLLWFPARDSLGSFHFSFPTYRSRKFSKKVPRFPFLDLFKPHLGPRKGGSIFLVGEYVLGEAGSSWEQWARSWGSSTKRIPVPRTKDPAPSRGEGDRVGLVMHCGGGFFKQSRGSDGFGDCYGIQESDTGVKPP